MAVSAEFQVPWGARQLTYSLQRGDTRRLRIVVRPDGRVIVTAPGAATDEAVKERVQRRGDWIVRQLERFARWHPRTPTRQYVSGETHLFQGRQLRLRILDADENSVAILGDRLIVSRLVGAGSKEIRVLVKDWYAKQARRLLRERFLLQSEAWRRHGLAIPSRLIVRSLVNRWGSLTAAGNLVLNTDLVRASPRLVDYVIAHEIAHIPHANHGRDWQMLLTKMMADWRERKSQLEQQLM